MAWTDLASLKAAGSSSRIPFPVVAHFILRLRLHAFLQVGWFHLHAWSLCIDSSAALQVALLTILCRL